MDEAVIERLTPDKFLTYWPRIQHELQTVPHVWQDYWTLESIRDATLHGNWQCWAAGDALQVKIVCWTQISYYPAGPVFQVFLAIGEEVDQYLDSFNVLAEKFGHDLGCKMIEVTGRAGWGPKLRKYGFTNGTTSLKKRLNEWRLQ